MSWLVSEVDCPHISKKDSKEGGHVIKLHCVFTSRLSAPNISKLIMLCWSPVVKAINYFRSKALHHWQFQQFLVDIQVEYGDVIYRKDVRWLKSGVRNAERTLSQRGNWKFFGWKEQPIEELSASVLMADLAFSVDITKHLNALNVNFDRGHDSFPEDNIGVQMMSYATAITSLSINLIKTLGILQLLKRTCCFSFLLSP